jgi:hypothetical protein
VISISLPLLRCGRKHPGINAAVIDPQRSNVV